MVLPVPNKQAFPPEYKNKSRLTYYASLFNSLEVNSSFYKIPMAATVKRWAAEVPDTFQFTFKLFREITHNKGLEFDKSLVERFMTIINGTGNKKGCLLVQFPASTTINLPQLKKLLSCIQKFNKKPAWNISVEFRHTSWYCSDTYQLLQKHNAGMVIHDMPKSATPSILPWTKFIYLRYHGQAGDYRGSYSIDFLQQQATMTTGWIKAGHIVYAYFNNTIGDAVSNVADITRLVASPQPNPQPHKGG